MERSSSRPAPFFIVGAQRSGTTMLRLMLNNHPNLAIPHESGFITIFYSKLADYGDLQQRENVTQLLRDISEYHLVKRGGHVQDPEAILSEPIAGYADLVNAIYTVYARQKGKGRWGDKTPFYTPDIDILWTLFPGCYIVHLVRDGRDRAVSMRSIKWGSSNLPRLAEDWRWKTMVAHKIGMVLGKQHYLEVRYEDLVLKTEEVLRTICAFLHEPYQEDMLAYHTTAAQEVPAESIQWHTNSVKAPDASKLYTWKQKMSLSDRIIFEQVAADALELFGYERQNHPSTWASRLKNLYYSTVRRW
jgi:hypothetical protein